MKKFLFLIALFTLMGGVNSVKAETIVTKTPIVLTGGKFSECFTSGTYYIEMNGWQNFTVYEDAIGVAFDENSTMVFDMAEQSNNDQVRVVFTYEDGTTSEIWWCTGIGSSADDPTTQWNHKLDNSTFWLKKGLGDNFDTKKDLKITKVTVNNQNFDGGIFKINGGTVCGQTMTIKKQGQWYDPTVFGTLGGEFSATAAFSNIFQMKPFEVGDNQKIVIKFDEAVPSKGNWNLNNNSGPTSLSGKTEYEFALDGTAISDFTIFNWDANPDPIKISEVYFYKEEDTDVLLNFDEFGFARSSKKDLVAADGLSYDPETGVLTSDGTAGTLTLEFTTPQDLLDLNIFDVRRSGNDNIVNRLKFYDEDDKEINTWNGARLYNSGLDGNATRAFKNNKAVKKLVWESDEEAAKSSMTLTITEIQWQLKTISAMKGTDITTLSYQLWDNDGDNDATPVSTSTPDKNFAQYTDAVIYGKQNIDDSKNYVDLTNYKKLLVRGYGTIRLFYNWHQKVGEEAEEKPIDATSFVNGTGEVKTMELDIPTFMANNSCSHFHLIGVKGSGKCYVESISVLDGTEKYDYAISGKGGLKLQSTVDALADVKATAIDASALTNAEEFKVTLTPANPNCLIKVNSDQLDNESNVIVGSTCANLVLTDGYPFKAPADFTATAASYSTTINEEAGAGTLCLPFAATIPGGVTAYTLTYSNGADKAVATPVETTIPANTPVLLNGSGAAVFTGSGAVSASAANESGALTGVFKATTVPENKYVLQNGDNGLGFYKVVTDDIVANPFRAYLTALLGARTIGITYGGVTNINKVKANKVGEKDVYYNLNGQRVSNPTKGVFIKNGVKVSF